MADNAQDISFVSGADSEDYPGGNIVFTAGNSGDEVLRFCPNGDFVYRDKVVKTDIELYLSFKAFLAFATIVEQPDK